MKDKIITIIAQQSEGRKDYCIAGLCEWDLGSTVQFLVLSLTLDVTWDFGIMNILSRKKKVSSCKEAQRVVGAKGKDSHLGD